MEVEIKTNSAQLKLELEIGLSLAIFYEEVSGLDTWSIFACLLYVKKRFYHWWMGLTDQRMSQNRMYCSFLQV